MADKERTMTERVKDVGTRLGQAWQRGAEVAYDAMGGRATEEAVNRATKRKKSQPQGRTSSRSR